LEVRGLAEKVVAIGLMSQKSTDELLCRVPRLEAELPKLNLTARAVTQLEAEL
jgi:hypothetical protein